MIERGQPLNHIYPVLLPERADRKGFMMGLRDKGVQSSIHYWPIHISNYYVERSGEHRFPVTEAVFACEVTLPLNPKIIYNQVDLVIESVEKLIRNVI